jgi:hypothetical protein
LAMILHLPGRYTMLGLYSSTINCQQVTQLIVKF